jgi:hypothetical protein
MGKAKCLIGERACKNPLPLSSKANGEGVGRATRGGAACGGAVQWRRAWRRSIYLDDHELGDGLEGRGRPPVGGGEGAARRRVLY